MALLPLFCFVQKLKAQTIERLMKCLYEFLEQTDSQAEIEEISAAKERINRE